MTDNKKSLVLEWTERGILDYTNGRFKISFQSFAYVLLQLTKEIEEYDNSACEISRALFAVARAFEVMHRQIIRAELDRDEWQNRAEESERAARQATDAID